MLFEQRCVVVEMSTVEGIVEHEHEHERVVASAIRTSSHLDTRRSRSRSSPRFLLFHMSPTTSFWRSFPQKWSTGNGNTTQSPNRPLSQSKTPLNFHVRGLFSPILISSLSLFTPFLIPRPDHLSQYPDVDIPLSLTIYFPRSRRDGCAFTLCLLRHAFPCGEDPQGQIFALRRENLPSAPSCCILSLWVFRGPPHGRRTRGVRGVVGSKAFGGGGRGRGTYSRGV